MGAYSCKVWEYVRPALRWQRKPGYDSDTPAFRPRVTIYWHGWRNIVILYKPIFVCYRVTETYIC
jgi:hypothetical protein